MWQSGFFVLLVCCTAPFAVHGISGGHDTKIHFHPYMVSLEHDNEHFCGASLLYEDWNTLQWAVTSARCASQYQDKLTIRAGSVNVSTGGEVYTIETIVVHPDYDPETFDNDIALIKTSEKVWADNSAGSYLPRTTTPITDMQSITILGWGATKIGGDFSEVLQMIQIPYRLIDHCRSCYSEVDITENMFCAGWTENGNVTACDGDFGGPGMITGFIYGIQSWGKSCGDGKHPTVFTTIVNYLDWIEDTSGIKPL